MYSQWFPGKDNVIADCLSRDTHLSDSDRIGLLSSFFTKQNTPHFKRVQIPSVISDWVCSILRLLPKREQIPERHMNSGLVIGVSGRSSLSPSELEAIDTWNLFPPLAELQSSGPSPRSFDNSCTREVVLRKWLQGQSAVPLGMYHRGSKWPEKVTQDWTSMEKSALGSPKS